MPLVSQKVPNLLGGVSQQDERLRRPNQGDEQINGLSDAGKGLSKRPPSEYVALLDATVSSYETAWVHTIDRDIDDKYRVIIRDGDLKVYRVDDGSEVTVVFPEGKAYLAEATAGPNFRAVTVEDTTFIVNQEFVTAKDTEKEPAVSPEAMVWVREASENMRFYITLDGETTQEVVAPASSFDRKVRTEWVATQLETKVNALTNAADYTVERIGSALFIKRTDGAEFTIKTKDDLGDQGLVLVKGTAQNIDELPPKAKHGFTVKILGEQGSEYDDYWVTYRETPTTGLQVWEEVRAPSSLLGVDNSTMPHQLILRGTLADEGTTAGAPAEVQSTLGYASEGEEYWGLINDAPVADQALTLHGDYATWDCPAILNGKQVKFTLSYGVDTSNIYPGERMETTWERYNSADVLQETLGVVEHAQSNLFSTYTQSALTTVASGDYLKITMEYGSGATPVNNVGYIDIGNPGGTEPILYQYDIVQLIDFGEDLMYPGGFYYRVTLNSKNFDFTPTSDATGTAVAAGLAALITADGDYTATASAGVLNIAYVGASDPGGVVTFEFDRTYDAWFPDLDLSGLTLTGSTVQNLSDGSEGTITAQPSSTTISTSGLTGGTDNLFTSGDLIRFTQGGTFFVFRSVDWTDRPAGDEETNPFPDFIGRTLTDITYYQGRLGFIYKDRIYFSAAGKLKHLFKHSARILRDDDPIGAESALPQVAAFDAAITWNKALYLRSENAIVYVGGDPRLGLTPRTIRMDLAAAVDSSASCPPAVVGKSLFLARPRKPMGIQVVELRQAALDVLEYYDITDNVPTYLCGRPIRMAGDGAAGLLFLLPTDCTQNVVYVYSYMDQQNQRVLASWSQWQLPEGAEILSVDVIDGSLGLVMKYSDGVYLETIELDEGL